jgi:hypothetical protein
MNRVSKLIDVAYKKAQEEVVEEPIEGLINSTEGLNINNIRICKTAKFCVLDVPFSH